MHLLRTTAYLDTYGGGATETEVEQQEIRFLLFQQFPVGCFAISRANHFRLGDVVADDSQCAFEFEGHVLDDNHFEVIHIFTIY